MPGDDKIDNFYSEFKEKMGADSLNDVLGDQHQSSRTVSIVAGVLLGVLVSTGIGWYLISSYSQDNAATQDLDSIPVIRPDARADRVPMDQPDGMQVPDRDKMVYNRISQVTQRPDDGRTARFAPPAEQPEEIVMTDDRVVATPVVAPRQPTRAPGETRIQPPPAGTPSTAVFAPQTLPVATATAPAAPQPAAPRPVLNFQDGGPWRVQLVSAQNQAGVTREWTRLQSRVPALRGQPHDVTRADLGERGIFFRLRAGEFRTRAEAESLCASVRAANENCIVVR
ncbi:MAG: SPOR domain-containing protein [Alphaproteobacteria bacterium]|nr:SPOR domain-containing protein [Alphaproteobacteria bacterium]